MRKTEVPQESDAPKRDRHGDRGVPAPLPFDIHTLPDSTLLTQRDVAAHARVAVATVQKWRGRPDHPLKWTELPGGFVRTTVGYLKQFLASGKPRPRLTPPRASPLARFTAPTQAAQTEGRAQTARRSCRVKPPKPRPRADDLPVDGATR